MQNSRIVGLFFLVALSAFLPRSVFAAADKPNIIFILFDDMGYGQPPNFRADSQFRTPNLDRLAKEGMRFTDAHSAAAVCTPTRYGVITGRYPSRIAQYGVLETFSAPIIERDRLTVGEMFRRSGYHTACIGKWHLGMTWEEKVLAEHKGKSSEPAPIGAMATDGPIARGFDYFTGYTHARNIGMIMEQDKVAANVKEVETQPLMAKRAVAYIDDQAKSGAPFFLYLPLSTPHTPIVPAAEFKGKSGVDSYGDWIFEGDAVTGQVLEALERNHIADNTLVLVSSDNGAAGRSYKPLRAAKTSIYEGGHREPFYARWPGKIKAGSVCDDTICLNDLMATCAEILNFKLPDDAGVDSFSILPDLLGTASGPVRPATVHQSEAGDLAIRQGPWKLIFLTNGQRELYNLKTDLSETKSVAAENPEIVKSLATLMQQYIDNGRSTPGAAQKNNKPISLTGKVPAKGKKKREEKVAADPNFD